MTPKTAALAYRIWAYANPRGWDCTMAEVADHIGVSPQTVGRIAQVKHWSSRFRGCPIVAEEKARFSDFHRNGMSYVSRLESTDFPASVELPE